MLGYFEIFLILSHFLKVLKESATREENGTSVSKDNNLFPFYLW